MKAFWVSPLLINLGASRHGGFPAGACVFGPGVPKAGARPSQKCLEAAGSLDVPATLEAFAPAVQSAARAAAAGARGPEAAAWDFKQAWGYRTVAAGTPYEISAPDSAAALEQALTALSASAGLIR